MNRKERIELCKDYIYYTWQIERAESLFDDSVIIIPANGKRINTHEKIAEAFGFEDTLETEDVCYNLPDVIGIDFSKQLSDSDFRYYGERLHDALVELKAKLERECEDG